MFVYIQVLFGECFDEVGLSLRDQKKNDIALYFKYFNWFYQLS